MTASDIKVASTDPGSKGRASQTWKSIAKSASARVLVLPVSALLGIFVTRLVISDYGPAAFGQYGLLVGIAAMLPFADLGMAAVIMNAVSSTSDPGHDEHVRHTLISAIRLLCCSASAIILIALLITAFGGWHTLLGDGLMPDSGPIAAMLCLAMVGLALPLGIGQRILTGLGRNHITVITMGLQTPLVLGTLALLIRIGAPAGGFIPVIAYAATFVLSALTCALAARRIQPAFWVAVRQAVSLRRVRGARVFDLAWPMLIQMIALPIAMQSDRVVISHLAGLDELTHYNLASQMYTPVWSVVNAAGVALWPIFNRERTGGLHSGTSPHRLALVFATAAAAVTGTITVVSGPLANFASSGKVALPLALALTFSVLMVFQAAKYPLGMYMTDAPGLRFQAFMILLMLPVNLGLSIALAEHFGATGPVVGSAVGVLACQLLPNWLYVRRSQRRATSSTR